MTDSWAQGAVPVIGSLNKINSPDTLVGEESSQSNIGEFEEQNFKEEEEEDTKETMEANSSEAQLDVDDVNDEFELAHEQRYC